MLMRTFTTLLVVVMLFGVGTASGEQVSDNNESPEVLETVLNLRIIDTVLTILLEREDGIEKEEGWVDLHEVVKRVPDLYRGHLPLRDGWNEDFLCLTLDGNTLVLSKGENGEHQFLKGIETLEDIRKNFDQDPKFGDDMALAIGRGGEILSESMIESAISKRAMADMRSIGTAVESYAIDNNSYPVQGGGLVPLTVLREIVEPFYIRYLPMVDPWDEPFVYWSDGSQYILISTGSDRLFDRSYLLGSDSSGDNGYLGLSVDWETDLVFANGQFVQWHQEGRQ